MTKDFLNINLTIKFFLWIVKNIGLTYLPEISTFSFQAINMYDNYSTHFYEWINEHSLFESCIINIIQEGGKHSSNTAQQTRYKHLLNQNKNRKER